VWWDCRGNGANARAGFAWSARRCRTQ
jgi:hypothetical protein